MAEMFNKNEICRCCHSDDDKNITSMDIEYCDMLKDTFGIQIKQLLPTIGLTICQDCTKMVRAAAQFKLQVLLCEQKLEKHYNNDQGCDSMTEFKTIKKEESLYGDDDSATVNYDDFQTTSEVIAHNSKDTDVIIEIKNPIRTIIKEDDDSATVNYDDFQTTSEEISHNSKDTDVIIEIKNPIRTFIKEDTDVIIEIKNPIKTITKEGESQKPKRNQTEKYDSALEIHMETENGVIFSCKVCGEKYATQKLLKLHIVKNHKYTYHCNLCNKKFIIKRTFESHMKVHLNGKTFECIYCKKKFGSKKLQRSHEKLHNKLVKYICDVCNKEFSCKLTLGRHIKLHTGTLTKKLCHICGRSFNDNTQLRKHIESVHEKLRPFICSRCPKTFSAEKHLKYHVMRKHSEGDPIALHKCNLCPRDFLNIHNLKNHMKLHDDGREYICKLCNEIFSDKKNYLSHVRNHRIETLFCELCGKKFTCKFTLRRHTKEHGNKKQYSCDICGKRFLQKHGILRHKLRQHDPTANDREKFKCKICKLNVVDLDKHVEVHYNRPYGCDYCDKTFSQKRYLTRHIKITHYGSRPHECGICGANYVQLRALKKHTLKVHNMVLKTEKDNPNNDVVTNSSCKSENDNKV